MGNSDRFHLNTEQLRIIEQAIRTESRTEVSQRALSILMLHLGTEPNQVANMLSVSLGTIYNWHRRWRQGGLSALANRPKSGRPPIADESYMRILLETINQAPADLGYHFDQWTVDRLSFHMEKSIGKRLSPDRLRVLLKQEGYLIQDCGARSRSPSPVEENNEVVNETSLHGDKQQISIKNSAK
jgi:transposase